MYVVLLSCMFNIHTSHHIHIFILMSIDIIDTSVCSWIIHASTPCPFILSLLYIDNISY